MRFDRLDLNLLAALDVLIDVRSVSEAARRMHLSQPAVTGALNRLRDFFEDDLLVQRGRRMLLTPKAEELAAPVRRALALIRAEITSPGQFEPTTSNRRFLLAVSDYAYTILVADLIAAASSLAPGVSFEIVPPGTHSSERLERAEVDIFVTVAPFAIADHPRLPLWRDEEVVISCADSGHPKHIDAETFFSTGHAVALFGPDRQPSLADTYLAAADHSRRIDLLLPSFSLLPQAVVGTRRLATMHRLYAQHFARYYPIQIHSAWQAFPEIVEIAQWHEVRSRDPGLQWLIGLFEDHIARLPADARPV